MHMVTVKHLGCINTLWLDADGNSSAFRIYYQSMAWGIDLPHGIC